MESPAKKAKVSNNSQQQQQQSQKIILSVGAAVIDYLGKLDHYPKQEEKARTQGCDIAFGGKYKKTFCRFCVFDLNFFSKVSQRFLQ